MKYRKNINEALNLVRLDTTSYSNLKYDSDGTQKDTVNKALLDDIQTAAKSVGIVATITTAKTGHNKMVKSGKSVSRHMDGTGVDVAVLNGMGSGGAKSASDGSAQFRALGNKLKDALVSMGYKWNVESGNDKAVLWQTNTGGNHYNHLHISNRTGQTSGSPSALSSDGSVTTDETTKPPSAGYDIVSNMLTAGLNLDKLPSMVGLKEEVDRIKKLLK